MGGFHLVDLIITELKDHIQVLSLVENLFLTKNPLQDLLSCLNSVISTNERNGILTDHVIFKLRYNEIYQMKTTMDPNNNKIICPGCQEIKKNIL